MKKFLQQIAETYWAEAGPSIGDMCFVFPNRRSSAFFRYYLGRAAGKSVFAPKLLTINDLFTELSGLRKIDKISALYRLYRHYAQLMWPEAEPGETFDQFVYWGDILLADFDDIDKYMVDARLLFANIHDINEIGGEYSYLSARQAAAIREFWRNFLISGPESVKIQSFSSVWSILFRLYTEFREELEAEGTGYEGMIYRKVAGRIKDSDSKEVVVEQLGGYGKIVFVGLNALNECEKTLLDLIRDRLCGDFYWDFEDARTQDKANKSSLFISANRSRYGSRFQLRTSLPEKQEFRTFAVPSSVGQTRVAGELLREFASQNGFDPMETAIVLPDENLLMPMLGAVPEEIGNINVTMGYPLSASNTATFVRFLEHLQRNCRISRSGAAGFYHRDVANLLNHPYLVEENTTSLTLSEIIGRNDIYPEASYLAGKSDLWAKVFVKTEDAEQVCRYLLDLVDAVSNRVGGLDREFLYHLGLSVRRISSLHIPMRADTCFSLVGQLISAVSVPFEGEPLHGLQIMGPLETRALDFKNIIILSMTEGVFPKRSVSGSFIPYNIRFGFGLPTYEYQDALSSYYFYRSIARAENVCFIYDSTTGGMQSGEASRFIKQLKYHFGVELNLQAVSFPLDAGSGQDKEPGRVDKSPQVMAALREKFLTGEKPKPFSASSINAYIDCPLSFYYKYVAGIEENDEVAEGLDSSLFGSIFHKTMELIYRPYVGKTLSRADIRAIAADEAEIECCIDKAFLEECNIGFVSGRNMIVKQLIRRFAVEVLGVDANNAPITPEGTERALPATMTLADGTVVRLFGIIDRVERRADGRIHIIDYKSGTVKGKVGFKQVGDMFSPDDNRPSIAMQLFMYAFLAVENGIAKNAESCIPSIYALRTIFDGPVEEMLVPSDALSIWKECLKRLLEEIFNPDVPFSACGSENRCKWCSYKTLCGK